MGKKKLYWLSLGWHFESFCHLAHLTSPRFSTQHHYISHPFPPTWSTDCQEYLPLLTSLPLCPFAYTVSWHQVLSLCLCSPPKLDFSHGSSMAFFFFFFCKWLPLRTPLESWSFIAHVVNSLVLQQLFCISITTKLTRHFHFICLK